MTDLHIDFQMPTDKRIVTDIYQHGNILSQSARQSVAVVCEFM